MRLKLIILFIILSNFVNATEWYFDSEGGSDANNGLTISTPKQTALALQTVFNSLVSGDIVYLKAGSQWDDYAFTISSKTGTLASPILITKYGTGAKPIIHCYRDISGSWTQAGSSWTKNIGTSSVWAEQKWVEYTGAPPSNGHYIWNYLNFLLIDGVPYSMGKYPNSGYIHFDAISSDHATWTDYASNWTTNQWSGAMVSAVPCNQIFVLDRAGIYSNSANSLSVNASQLFTSYNDFCTTYAPQEGFITNDPSCNTGNGDWSYTHSSGSMNIYWSGTLNSSVVEIPGYNYAIDITSSNYITFSGIQFEGGIIHTIRCDESDNITFDDCYVRYSPVSAIWGFDCDNFTVSNCTINKACNMAIALNNTGEATITSNILTNIGTDEAMGGDRFMTSYFGVWVENRYDTVTISDNYIDSTGYSGIGVNQSYNLSAEGLIINDNIVIDYCQLLSDGAGIYVHDTVGGLSTLPREIKRNIIYGYTANTDIQTKPLLANCGIYLDSYSAGFTVDGNTSYGGHTGIYLHPGRRDSILNNNFFKPGIQNDPQFPAGWTSGNGTYTHFGYGNPTNLIVKKNTIVVTESDNYVAQWQYDVTFINPNCVSDSNWYYNSFLASTGSMFSRMQNYVSIPWTFTQWKEASGFDANSTVNKNGMNYSSSPLTSDGLIKLVSNLSADSTRTINLYDLTFEDKDGNAISDSVVLSPKESRFLFRNESIGTTSNMDLIVEMGWGTGILGEEASVDTIFFENYSSGNNVDVVYSADCADSVVTRYLSGGGAVVTDTLLKANLTDGTSYWDLSGWTNTDDQSDSTLVAPNVYLINQSNMQYNGSGRESGTIWPTLVSNSLWFLPNTDNNPDTIILRGSGLSGDYLFTVMGISTHFETGDDRNTYLYVGADGDTVETISNLNEWLTVDSITATNNTIRIVLDREDGKYGYLGGIVLLRSQTLVLDTTQSWVYFPDVNFGAGMDSIRYAVDFNQSVGEKSFELRLNSQTGTLIDSFNVDAPGCGIRSADLPAEITGTYDLYALLDTLDQYDWMKFYKKTVASTIRYISDTLYMDDADVYSNTDVEYSDSCGDSVVYHTLATASYIVFNDVYADIYPNRVSAKIVLDGSIGETVFTVNTDEWYMSYNSVPTDSSCHVIDISIPEYTTFGGIGLGGLKDYSIYFAENIKIAWVYFYYKSEPQYSIKENGINYSIRNKRISN